MDILPALKASSVLLTGAFGVLGLLKDYKDKSTGRITKWGKVSLSGILISSALGLATQLRESSDAANASRATANQTLELAKNTNNALHQLERTLSPIDGMTFEITFPVPCGEEIYFRFCKEADAKATMLDFPSPVSPSVWKFWPGSLKPSPLSYTVAFFTDAKAADAYMSPDAPASLGGDLFFVVADDHPAVKASIRGFPPNDILEAFISSKASPFSLINVPGNNGKIRSEVDLSGATIVVSTLISPIVTPITAATKPTKLSLVMRNGEEFVIGGNEVQTVREGDELYFRAKIPKRRE